MGGDPGAPNSPEYQNFMKDFKEGFATGAAASQQYQQFNQNVQSAEKAGMIVMNPVIRFFFGNTTGLSWLICCMFFHFSFFIFHFHSSLVTFLFCGIQPKPTIYYILLTMCALRLGYIFLIASPEQTASLSNILLRVQ